MPSIDLRQQPEPAHPARSIDPSLTLSAKASNEPRSEEVGRALARYQWMNQVQALTRVEHPERTALARAFEPAVVQWRKVSISGSLVTAIRRKNPLCLLNPIVLSIDW